MRIGIAGAGIGGLAAAALLARDGHEVRVFDKFDTPRPVGSGLVIQPVGMDVLREAGAALEVAARGAALPQMVGDEVSGNRVVLSVRYGETADRQGLGIHRAALFQALHDAALEAGAQIIPSCPVEGRDGRHLRIAARHEGPFDLIVDALGAGSCLSLLRARALPYGAVWATVLWPECAPFLGDRLTQRYRRADRMLGVLPIGTMPDAPAHPLAAIFYSLRTDTIDAHFARPFDEFRAEADTLWPDFAAFLPEGLGHANFTAARYTHGSLRKPFDDGLAHIGDAAHRASPQLGRGQHGAARCPRPAAGTAPRTGGVGAAPLRRCPALVRRCLSGPQCVLHAAIPVRQRGFADARAHATGGAATRLRLRSRRTM